MSRLRHASFARSVFAAAALALAAILLLAACGDDAVEPAAEETAETATESVEYEPAYPEEVSAETLDAGDTAQQEEAHSHGAETHVHEGEEDHHDGDDGHSH